MDYDEIEYLRNKHHAWGLLASRNVALVLHFLGRVFVDGGASNVAASKLEAALDEELYALNELGSLYVRVCLAWRLVSRLGASTVGNDPPR